MGNRFGKGKRNIEGKKERLYFSALLPLTRRYHTDLILQHIRRLSCRLYIYTLFTKQKSIIGNTCAQILMNGEGFVYVHPMQYKSHAGETLNAVTRDIGDPRTLI